MKNIFVWLLLLQQTYILLLAVSLWSALHIGDNFIWFSEVSAVNSYTHFTINIKLSLNSVIFLLLVYLWRSNVNINRMELLLNIFPNRTFSSQLESGSVLVIYSDFRKQLHLLCHTNGHINSKEIREIIGWKSGEKWK